MFIHGGSGKAPFEDRVRDYIAAHPGDTIEQCAADLGISAAAVAVACQNMVDRGAAAWVNEDEE